MPTFIQVIPRTVSYVGYADNFPQLKGIADGSGDGSVFGFHRHPIAVAGTLRNLGILDGGNLPAGVTTTISKNGAGTTLAATITPGMGQAFDAVHEVAIVAGDYASYVIGSVGVGYPGYDLGFCLEWESTHQIFGLSAATGTSSVGAKGVGGAFGNGRWAPDPGDSSSFSAIYGSLTHLMLQRYVSPVGGSFRAWYRLNGVDQDGTGGTVNTVCDLDDAGSDTALITCNLPIVPWDHCDVVIERLGTTSDFAIEQVGAGMAFLPQTLGQFILSGGSNDVIPNGGTTWKWNQSREQGATIEQHQAPTRTTFTALALYVERTVSAGGGNSFTHTLLRTGTPSDLSVPLPEPAVRGIGAGSQQYIAGDVMTIAIDNVGGPSITSRLHWSIGAALGGVTVTGTPTPTPVGSGSFTPDVPLSGSAAGSLPCIHGSAGAITGLSGSI